MDSPFKNFDFSKQPVPTPLTQLLDEVLVYPYLRGGAEEEATGGVFLPLPFQTGIGKTYTALSCILEEMLWQIQVNEIRPDNPSAEQPNFRKRMIIYITDSVVNVNNAYNDLLGQIKQDNRFDPSQKKHLKEQVCYLPRQATHLRYFSESGKDIQHILRAFELWNDEIFCKELTDLIKYLSPEKTETKTKTKTEYSSLDENNIRSIYRRLISKIEKKQRSPSPVNLNREQTEALDLLVPGYRFERGASHVLFMTTKKYLTGFDQTKGKFRPLRNLSGQFLIIDEVDKQNAEILNHIVEKKARDLISTNRTLKVNFDHHLLENSARYHGVEDKFQDVKKKLDAFADTWNLDYSYNIDGKTLGDYPVRLFSDRAITHTPHSKSIPSKSEGGNITHFFHLELDKELRKNIIKATERDTYKPGEDFEAIEDESLTKFVNEADRCYQYFLYSMYNAVQLYVRNSEKLPVGRREDRSTASAYQEAVGSILAHYNLHGFANDVFEAFSAQSLKKSQPVNQANKSYHCTGLQLIDIHRDEQTIDTVNCEYYGFNRTPTGLLADMVESGAVVLGISATANANTVIHNFDVSYLQRRMGDCFLELSSEQRKTVHDYYISNRNYARAGVEIKATYIGVSDSFINKLIRQWKPKASNLEFVWEDMFKHDDNSNISFQRAWLSKLMQAIKSFIADDDNRYMMAFCNRTVSRDKDNRKLLVEFIEYCIQHWANEHNRQVRLFDGIDAKSIQDGERYNDMMKYLKEQSGKAIALTTYASMGAGKNPDYKVSPSSEDKQSLHYVGPDNTEQHPGECSTDIDTLYLERPTHLLLSIKPYYSNPDKLVLFHQILSLQESGDISPKNAIGWVRDGLANESRYKNLTRYYETSDYYYAVRKIIEQAVGRTARTPLKRGVIRLFADIGLTDFLSGDERDKALLSHEYVALLEAAKKGRQAINTEETREIRRQYNLAARNNMASKALINGLLKRFGNKDAIDINAIETWAALREQLLRFPALSDLPDEWSRIYLQSPEQGEYRYEGHSDTSLYDYEFFDRVKSNSGFMVCEKDSDLSDAVKCSIVKRHFVEQGYALEWGKHAWIMTPVMFADIYRPAIAEQACKAILTDNGITWEEMPDEDYEMYDAIIQYKDEMAVFLDVKNWRKARQADDGMIKKAELAAPKRIVYINLFGSPNDSWRHLDRQFVEVRTAQRASVLELPGLLNKNDGTVLQKNIQYLRQWLLQDPTNNIH